MTSIALVSVSDSQAKRVQSSAVISRAKAPILLIAPAVILAIVAMFFPAIPQPLSYHNFADHRGWLGIPNFGDVVSNVPFAIVGIWGLVVMFTPGKLQFLDSRERWPYLLMFASLILTAIGSGYYHLAPDNARLVWDRIPIMIVFMALLAAVVAERAGVNTGLALFPVLEIVGVASVLYWQSTEQRGHGDLRLYAAVQVYAILILLLALLLPPRFTGGSDLVVVLGFYALAKVLEGCDRQVFALGHIVSGHTLKHLAAAAAGFWVLRMMKKRVAISR